jgi:hypothetical protein
MACAVYTWWVAGGLIVAVRQGIVTHWYLETAMQMNGVMLQSCGEYYSTTAP